MKLIIGGAFQGKKTFAYTLCPEVSFIDGAKCAAEDIFSCGGIYHFHEYIRNRLREGMDCHKLGEELTEKNPSLVVVTNELGCGVVPVDAFDREYRERTGRVCTVLAAASDEVYRVICGVGLRIK